MKKNLLIVKNRKINKKDLKKSHSIGNIVAHSSLTSNANLILIYRCFNFRLLDLYVLFHFLSAKIRKIKIKIKTIKFSSSN